MARRRRRRRLVGKEPNAAVDPDGRVGTRLDDEVGSLLAHHDREKRFQVRRHVGPGWDVLRQAFSRLVFPERAHQASLPDAVTTQDRRTVSLRSP